MSDPPCSAWNTDAHLGCTWAQKDDSDMKSSVQLLHFIWIQEIILDMISLEGRHSFSENLPYSLQASKKSM